MPAATFRERNGIRVGDDLRRGEQNAKSERRRIYGSGHTAEDVQ